MRASDSTSDRDHVEPWRVVCPACRADSAAPDTVLYFSDLASAPYTNYLLMAILCGSCGARFDVATWLFDKRRFLDGFRREAGIDLERDPDPDALATLDRYLRAVEVSRRAWLAWYESSTCGEPSSPASPGAEFPDVELPEGESHYPMVAMTVLAGARGYRQAACARPGQRRLRRFVVGPFTSVLSLDVAEAESTQPTYLHLSISKSVVPWHLSAAFSPIEGEFLLSLFFTPGERPFLRAEPGRVVPVLHVYLPAEASTLGDC